MYDNLSDLAFTSAYIGVVSSTTRASVGYYASLKDCPPKGVTAWYYEHTKGLIWIATGGEHAEPVTAWLHAAHRVFPCTTMLAALLENGKILPPRGGFAYYIPRHSIGSAAEQLLETCFAIYLPHSDEFLVLSELGCALAIDSVSGVLPEPTTIHRLADCVAQPREHGTGSYDPLDAQITEVLGPITDAATRAAADLVAAWKENLGEPVPSDIEHLEAGIEGQREQMRELRAARRGGGKGDLLSEVDRYAQWLRSMRRSASHLHEKVRDYECPRRDHATYESAATLLILRALQHYVNDLAEQLGINGCTFLPVLGQDFGMSRRLFQATESVPSAAQATASTVVIEVPSETRLRLGALPMTARPVSSVLSERLDEIALVFGEVERRRHPSVDSLLPRLHLRDGYSVVYEVERHQRLVKPVAKEIAADLLATALAGPPFVFAMARFAVGHLGDFRVGTVHATNLPSFRLRLRACLGLLTDLGIHSGFRSVYLPEGEMRLPKEIVDVVRSAVANVQRPTETELVRIAAQLHAGRVVEARPTTILSALWRGVATRSNYLHEVAALMSVAGMHGSA